MSSFLTNLETKTLQSEFTVTISEEVNAPMNYPGAIIMCGDKFKLEMFAIEAAYDGQTLYMYSADTDELTLSNPTQQELLETNPLLYAKALIKVCELSERNIGQQTLVTLTPRDQGIGINRFELRVRTEDAMPLQVDIKEGKKTTTLRLNNPKFIKEQQEFTIKAEGDTYINDMRL